MDTPGDVFQRDNRRCMLCVQVIRDFTEQSVQEKKETQMKDEHYSMRLGTAAIMKYLVLGTGADGRYTIHTWRPKRQMTH